MRPTLRSIVLGLYAVAVLGAGVALVLSGEGLQGPVVLSLSFNHGIHAGDLVSIAPFVVLSAVAAFVAARPARRGV
ncbi:MAG: hypothetical protein IPM45_04355 [Acidimicrobiales bacterium]|nr:hypothetical protein [Acidimicrobiales bacterium]